MGDHVLKSVPVFPGTSNDKAAESLLLWAVQTYYLEKVEGQWRAVEREATADIETSQLTAFAAQIDAPNILRFKSDPTFKWFPPIAPSSDMSPPLLRAYFTAILNVGVTRMMYRPYDSIIRKRIMALPPGSTRGEYAKCFEIKRKIGVHPLSYLIALKLRGTEDDPIHIGENSFVSGGTRRGFMTAVQGLQREKLVMNMDHDVLATAYLRFLIKNRCHIKSDPYPLIPRELEKINAGGPTSGGVSINNIPRTFQIGKLQVKESMRSSKAEGESVTKTNAYILFEHLDKKIRETGKDYDPSWFSHLSVRYMMAVKAESRKPGTDPDKTRIIFIVNQLKTFLDKCTINSSLKRGYGIGSNSIETTWQHGGAYEFLRRLGITDPVLAYVLGAIISDISRFDQSVLAGLLLLVCLTPQLYLNRMSKYSRVAACVMRHMAVNSTNKIVKWFGEEWRMMVGMMFSGDLITSSGDTWYSEIVLEAYDITMMQEIKSQCPPFYEQLKDPVIGFKRDKIYGDDQALVRHWKVIWYICGGDPWEIVGATECPPGPHHPVRLASFLEKTVYMLLKMEETYVVVPSTPRPDMTLPCLLSQLDNWGRLTHRGIKFLQRYFIKGGDDYVTYRPARDYMSKAACVAGNNQSVAIHIIRLRALAVDTHGTNEYAYEFLQAVHDELMAQASQKILALVDQTSAEILSEGADTNKIDKRLFHKIGKHSNAYLLTSFPTLGDIREIMVEDGTQENLRTLQANRKYMTGYQMHNVTVGDPDPGRYKRMYDLPM